MSLDEMKARRKNLEENKRIVLDNMQTIADESTRVANIAQNSRSIIDELDLEFETQTGLDGADLGFLFFATALQVIRIVLMNELTKIEKAGQGNTKEDWLHELQNKILGKYDDGVVSEAAPYYAPLNQIIYGRGVPYDATQYLEENLGIFKGANHRFATVGHDPVIGLVIGTANILTNTITHVDKSLIPSRKHEVSPISIGRPVISTHHVVYDSNLKNPQIGTPTFPGMMMASVIERWKIQPDAITAALIKQIIHIGTDMFTPCGIQIPGANLVLSNHVVEQLTKYVSMGDLVKIGASAGLAALINFIIGVLHGLLYDEGKIESRDIYAVKTKKILMISNSIATGSNLIWVGANVAMGDKTQIKNFDIGGLLITIRRLTQDPEFIRQVKEEYIIGHFNKLIEGESLQLQEIK